MSESKDNDIDLVFSAKASPEEITLTLIRNLILPILRRKSVIDGTDSAAKVCTNLIYALGCERIQMIGHDAIHELEGIISQLEERHFNKPSPSNSSCAVNGGDFYESDSTPS